MTNTAQWTSCCGTVLAALVLGLVVAGLTTPWWTHVGEEGGNLPPDSDYTSLWLTVSTKYQRWEEQTHLGCRNECDQTRWGSALTLIACDTWGDLCTAARFNCGSGVGAARTTAPPASSSTMQGVAPAPAMPTLTPAPFNGVPPLSPLPDNVGPPTTAAPTTTTMMVILPPSTTTTASPTTSGLQTLAPDPVPTLGPAWCPQLSGADLQQAPYTQWELHWSLSRQVIDEIDKQLNHVFFQIPPRFFAQRPTTTERIRLVWETVAARCNGGWLNEFDPCPSAPAQALFDWLHKSAQEVQLRQARQWLEPPQAVPVTFDDCGLKDVWDAWEEELRIHGQIVSVREKPTMAPLPALGVPSEPRAWPAPAPPPPVRPGPVMTWAECHKASYDPDAKNGGVLWHASTEPCAVATACTRIWVVRVGLLVALVLNLVHIVPATISLMGPEEGSALSWPLVGGVYTSSITSGMLLVALGVAASIGVPYGLKGPGLVCTACAFPLSLGSLGLSKLASDMAEAEKMAAAEKAAAGPLRVSQVPIQQRSSAMRRSASGKSQLPVTAWEA